MGVSSNLHYMGVKAHLVQNKSNQFWLKGLVACVIVGLVNCSPSRTSPPLISIKLALKESTSPVRVFTDSNLDEVTLAETRLDSTGGGVLSIAVDKPTMAHLQIGQSYTQLFLEPGYDLTVSDTQNHVNPFSFHGKGAEVNNYLLLSNRVVNQIKTRGNVHIGSLDLPKFESRYDSLTDAVERFHVFYTDSVEMTADMNDFLEKVNEMKLMLVRLEYLAFRLGDQKSNRVPELFGHLNENVSFDQMLVDVGAPDLMLVLYYQILNTHRLLKTKNQSGSFFVDQLRSDSTFRVRNFSPAVKELILAKNVLYSLAVDGLNPLSDSIAAAFYKSYPNSLYANSLKSVQKQWWALKPGNIAPNFEATDSSGRMFSLSDFRGRPVFIDVWATWCAPCLRAISHTKVLQRRYQQKIETIYLSIDHNKVAWLNHLRNDPTWSGTHLHVDRAQSEKLSASYRFSEIPSYMLIDQEGRIVSVRAPGPATAEIIEAIDHLLSQQTP